MTFELLFGLVRFAFVSSITPGPNNLMLMASGANFGFRRTIPHMLGISLGHGFMVFILGLGLVEVFTLFPPVRAILTVLCSLYLLWLAWKIANAAAPGEAATDARPLSFLQAAAFQWVNPKAIYMGITAQTYYAPENGGWIGAAAVAGAFILVNFPSVSVWAYMGTQIRRWLSSPTRLRLFNWSMAALLVTTLFPIIRSLFEAA